MKRTTVRLEDSLSDLARDEAARRGETLTALIEKGLRLVLSEKRTASRKRIKVPVSTAGGGLLPGVDLNDSASLLDIMEGRL